MTDPDLADLRRGVAARAVRVFDGRPVPPELVCDLIDVARWTGSARNRQPWRFVAVADARVLRALSRLGGYARHVEGAPCAVVLLSADDGRRDTAFDVGRVAQTLVLAATTAGLGCCPATIYPDGCVAEAARLLGTPDGWRPAYCFSLGYPGARPRGRSAVPTGRLAAGDLLTWV